jgi:hypothetical protein
MIDGAGDGREDGTGGLGGTPTMAGHAGPRGTSAGARASAADLARIERERLRVLVERDMDRAAELHAADFRLITPSGMALSKDEYLEKVRTHDIDYATWDAGEISVRIYGDAAVLRYPAEISFIVDEVPTPRRRTWHMDLYERRDDRWQVVWSQATEVRD